MRCPGMEETFFGQTEAILYGIARWVQLFIEALGILIITWGVLFSLFRYGRQLFGRKDQDYVPLRLSLGRYLVVALEFQLASDILATAVAPSWDDIGKLAVVAVIRTVLNYFLEREIKKEIEMVRSGDKDELEERMG